MRTKKILGLVGAAALAVTIGVSAQAGAPSLPPDINWIEGDAGDLIGTAESVNGDPLASLATITGDVGGSDIADLFAISLEATFSIDAAGIFALWLFDLGGNGVMGNVNFSDTGKPKLFATGFDPGTYILGITKEGVYPVSVTGSIFNLTTTHGMIDLASGPGGGDPLAGWNGTAMDPPFTITLTGAGPANIPEPAALAIFGFGLAGLGWAARRRKKA